MAHQTPGGVGVRRAPAFALIALLSLAFLAFPRCLTVADGASAG